MLRTDGHCLSALFSLPQQIVVAITKRDASIALLLENNYILNGYKIVYLKGIEKSLIETCVKKTTLTVKEKLLRIN